MRIELLTRLGLDGSWIPIQLTQSGPNKERIPPKEARIFVFGTNDTLKGKFILTRWGAMELMARYKEHGVRLMLDYEHGSLDPNATPEQKKASGRADVEMRDDGIWLTNIDWTPDADNYLRNAEYVHLSPAFKLNDDGEIIEIINCALTNLPATHDQEMLVAANRLTLSQENPMSLKEHLTAALSKMGGHEALSKHLEMSAERLTACLAGHATHEEMKKCAMKLGFDEKDLKEEKTSFNGQDVNDTQGNKTDGLGGLFELVGGETHIPTNAGEASEDQSGELKMSRSAIEAIVKLTGTSKQDELVDFIVRLKAKADASAEDTKTLSALREQVVKEHRNQLIEASRSKLTPGLIALAREMPVAQLKRFLDALPAQQQLEEPNPNARVGSGGKVVTLNREEKEVVKLSGIKDEEFHTLREALADIRFQVLSSGYVGPETSNAKMELTRTAWDHKYSSHVQHLSMMNETPDGKPWKPAMGSKFIAASRL